MTVGRPLAYDTDTVLDDAMRLFWQHGYEATSLHDLVVAMRLSRSSFYHGFGSKRSLFLRCLHRYEDQTTSLLRDRLESADSGVAFVAETLRWAIQEVFAGVEPKGCLVMNTATEFAQRDPQVAAAVNRGLDQYRSVFEAAVKRGQQEGSISPAQEPQVLAHYLVTTMSGLRTMVKAGTDPASLEKMVIVALGALNP